MEPSAPLFSNEEIDLAGLPAADQMHMIPLEPAYKTVRYISAALLGAVLTVISWLVVVVEPSLQPWGYVAAALITIMSVWMVVYNGISFHYMKYALREKDISYASGWLWKNMTTVPFNRVQHCDFRQGILDRRFGLAKLTIYTAGGQSSDLMIPGLLPETAEKLKAYILGSTEQSVETE